MLPCIQSSPKERTSVRKGRALKIQGCQMKCRVVTHPLYFWRTKSIGGWTLQSLSNIMCKVLVDNNILHFDYFRYLLARKTSAKRDCVVGCTYCLTKLCFCCSRQTGTFLIPLYMFTKVNSPCAIYWAHLCVCTVGSYASLSVCLSVCHFTKIQTRK